MKKLFWLLALIPVPLAAQITVDPNGNVKPTPVCVAQADGTCTPVTSTNPLPTSGSGGGGGGDASAANQLSTQAAPGSDASKATAVQGVTGGKPVAISAASFPLPAGAATSAKQPSTDTNGDLRTPTVTITETSVTLTANASTQLVAANSARIGLEIQCDGTAVVGLSLLGSTLTSAAAAPKVIPTGSYPLYIPLYATKSAITYYTATAQVCRVTQYAQQ